MHAQPSSVQPNGGSEAFLEVLGIIVQLALTDTVVAFDLLRNISTVSCDPNLSARTERTV